MKVRGFMSTPFLALLSNLMRTLASDDHAPKLVRNGVHRDGVAQFFNSEAE